MAGGVGGRPFEFNIKCVIFTLLVALGYWYLPHRSPRVLAGLLLGALLAVAWYSAAYACSPAPAAYVLFAAAVGLLYWWLPQRKVWALLLMLWLPYISMAWWDVLARCQSRLHPTNLPLGRLLFLPFKPPSYKAEYASLPPAKVAIMDRTDHVAGWTLLVGALAAVMVKTGHAKIS